MQNTQSTPQGWHVTNWGTWGWIETGLKLIGVGAGVAAFLTSDSTREMTVGGHPELGAVLLIGFLTMFTLVPLFLRFKQREIISMMFALANLFGHAGLLAGLLRAPEMRVLPLVFAIFIVLGEVTKQRFLVESGYTENGQTTRSMLVFSRVMMGLYALIGIFILI